MKGKLRNCVTGEVKSIELDYEVQHVNGKMSERSIFKLIGGVTGYESFYLKRNHVERIIKHGWYANVVTKDKYDGLYIPAGEMRKAFINSGCVGDDSGEEIDN